MLNNITVVVTTHNRHNLLESRVLPYFVDMKVSLLVIDSSPQAHQWSVSNPCVDYVHCPNEPLPHKLVEPVLSKVKTPYMLMHADDTLTSERGIVQCVEFLENNPDYSSAKGVVLQCHSENKERISTAGLTKTLRSIDADRGGDRLLQYFAMFDTNYYSVQRTDCWKKILKCLPKEMVNYYLADTYVALMGAIFGKIAVLPFFYQATEAGPSINENDRRYMCSPFKLATDSRYTLEVEATKQAAVQFLMEVDRCSEEAAQIFVDGALALYWLQDKKVKSFQDRIRGELCRLLNKTILKEKAQRQKEERQKEQQRREEEYVKEVLDSFNDVDMADYQRLMHIVQTTFMSS